MTLDPRRRFSPAHRTALYLHADGRCEHCGHDLDHGFDADHLTPHSRGGRTDMANGAVSCPNCNRSRKDQPMLTISTRRPAPLVAVEAGLTLRAWQQRAVPAILQHQERSFLLHVAPGGGKTIPALIVARQLIERGDLVRVVIVAPTANLARQWAATAHRIGLNITPNWQGQREPRDMHGIAITYQRVHHGALALAAGCRDATLVIADEPHHLGADRSWAAAFEQGFAGASRWVLLSGTPFRSDGRPIPGVCYQNGEARSDFTYGYGQAITDGVCRRVSFNFYDGQLRWISDGRRVEADFTLALALREASRRLRTALTPELSDGLRQMIGDAYAQLQEVREEHPDAAMLVVCESIGHAQATARIAEQVIGQPPVLVTSDEADATTRIERFVADRTPGSAEVVDVDVDLGIRGRIAHGQRPAGAHDRARPAPWPRQPRSLSADLRCGPTLTCRAALRVGYLARSEDTQPNREIHHPDGNRIIRREETRPLRKSASSHRT